MNKKELRNTGVDNGRLAAITCEVIFRETMNLPMYKEYRNRIELEWGEKNNIRVLIENAVDFMIGIYNETNMCIFIDAKGMQPPITAEDMIDLAQERVEIYLDRTFIGITATLFPHQVESQRQELMEAKKAAGETASVTVKELANEMPHLAEWYEMFLEHHKELLTQAKGA